MPNKTPQETLEMMGCASLTHSHMDKNRSETPEWSKGLIITRIKDALRALAEDIPEGMVEEVFCAVAIDGYVRRDDARTAIKAALLWLIGETE